MLDITFVLSKTVKHLQLTCKEHVLTFDYDISLQTFFL